MSENPSQVDVYLASEKTPTHIARARESVALCGTPLPPEDYDPIPSYFRHYAPRDPPSICPACQEALHSWKNLLLLTSAPALYLHALYHPRPTQEPYSNVTP